MPRSYRGPSGKVREALIKFLEGAPSQEEWVLENYPFTNREYGDSFPDGVEVFKGECFIIFRGEATRKWLASELFKAEESHGAMTEDGEEFWKLKKRPNNP